VIEICAAWTSGWRRVIRGSLDEDDSEGYPRRVKRVVDVLPCVSGALGDSEDWKTYALLMNMWVVQELM
jgi:hypothetical protein